MPDEITPKLFEHLVALAAFELDATEAAYLRRQLNNQLRAIHELAGITLDAETPLTSHGISFNPDNSPLLRQDEWFACPESSLILAQAPRTEERHVVVPDIPHVDLE